MSTKSKSQLRREAVMKKDVPTKTAAILTIRKVGSMSPAGRRAIAKWLRMHADDVVTLGKKYTDKTFVSKFLYR